MDPLAPDQDAAEQIVCYKAPFLRAPQPLHGAATSSYPSPLFRWKPQPVLVFVACFSVAGVWYSSAAKVDAFCDRLGALGPGMRCLLPALELDRFMSRRGLESPQVLCNSRPANRRGHRCSWFKTKTPFCSVKHTQEPNKR